MANNFGAKKFPISISRTRRHTIVISVSFPRFSSTGNPILSLPNPSDLYHVTYIQDGGQFWRPKLPISICRTRRHTIVISVSFLGFSSTRYLILTILNPRDAYRVTYIQDGGQFWRQKLQISISRTRRHTIVISVSFPGFSSTGNPILSLSNPSDVYHVHTHKMADNFGAKKIPISISRMRSHTIVISVSFPGFSRTRNPILSFLNPSDA